MAVRTFNGLALTQQWTTITPFTAPSGAPWTAIDIYANGIDVVFEIQEDPTEGITDSADSEVLCRNGFSSRPMPAFYGIKFRVWTGTTLPTTGTADVTLRTG